MHRTKTSKAELTFNLSPVTARELAAVLAGLRLLQEHRRNLDVFVKVVATNAGCFPPLNSGGIDRLCKRLCRGVA